MTAYTTKERQAEEIFYTTLWHSIHSVAATDSLPGKPPEVSRIPPRRNSVDETRRPISTKNAVLPPAISLPLLPPPPPPPPFTLCPRYEQPTICKPAAAPFKVMFLEVSYNNGYQAYPRLRMHTDTRMQAQNLNVRLDEPRSFYIPHTLALTKTFQQSTSDETIFVVFVVRKERKTRSNSSSWLAEE